MGPTPSLLILALTTWAQVPPPTERLATAAFAVARDPSGQKAAAAAGASLADRLQAHPRLRPIEPGRVLAGDPRTREEENLSRGRTALADGRRAYDALNLDEAIARLGQAVALYQQAGPLLGDMGELTTALAYLGAALTLRGSADEGQSTFLELLTLNPSYAPEGMPPTVMKIFDRAAEKLVSTPRGSVEIYSTPPYAAVYVDGQFRGVTPLTLSDLAAGTHFIRLEQNGYVVHGAPIEITANQRITSQTRLTGVKNGAELRDLLSRASREVLGEGMGPSLRSLSRLLVAEIVVVISVSQSGKDATLTGAAFDAGSALRLSTERAVVDAEGPNFGRDVGAMIDKLLAVAAGQAAPSVQAGGGAEGQGSAFGLAPGGAAGGGAGGAAGGGGGPPVVVSPRGADGSPEAGTVAGWMMVGVGGIGLATGVIFAILAKQTHSDYLATSQASPDLTSIRDDGKTKALVADIAMFGGGALALGGVITLLLTGGKSETPAELLGLDHAGLTPLSGGAMITVGGKL